MRVKPLLLCLLLGCDDGMSAETAADPTGGGTGRCGPAQAVVKRVIDGDTVELESGERVRYLLIDTPESTNGADDCFGHEAAEHNRQLVEGKTIGLTYDEECTDDYDRLLAYVTLDDRDINLLMVERGLACVLYIPPNGEDRIDDFEAAQEAAKSSLVGLWGACEDVTCD
jgi:micrococcal nuclease